MGNYDKAALLAHRIIVDEHKDPMDAWTDAIFSLSESPAVRRKVCPRVTFLALAESGFLHGVDVRESTRKVGILWERAHEAALYILLHPDATHDELCKALGYWDKQGSYKLIMTLAKYGVLQQPT
ncbi:hypothetical protein [Citrobacter sp. Ce129]|uniref:DUF6979 family protein n=1 Tax=Citrobacter sp. Ce129 TaxID=2985043 RepID=UPI002577B092|nr:hypothetical protein [Citrobacter sp. Ce129]MDM3270926.1 hypothetical protein [Citrobacter sp. Ce129]